MAKQRNGFVTNSSSSNFVLGFKDEDDFLEFKEYCKENGFKKVYKLVKHLRNGKYNHTPDEIKQNLIWYLSRDIRPQMYEKYIENYHALDYKTKAGKELELHDEEWFQKELYNKITEDAESDKILTRLEACSLLVQGCIWDNNGDAGLLEWAIRNDLLKDQFRRWCIINYNIG